MADRGGKLASRSSEDSSKTNKSPAVIGPVLPKSNLDDVCETSKGDVEVERGKKDLYGPALPPNFTVQNARIEDQVIGPALPPGFTPRTSSDESESDEEAIGPMPSSDTPSSSYVVAEFERRAQKMKDKLEGKTEILEPKRESWMTELPTNYSKQFGLGPRTFQKRAAPKNEDRSVWTDTPADLERKATAQAGTSEPSDKEAVNDWDANIQKRYDDEMKKVVEDHESKRSESLMAIHKKNLKRKKDKDNNPAERRPFDRDVDLKVNKLDIAQREAMLKRSRQLNDKFSHGKGQFL